MRWIVHITHELTFYRLYLTDLAIHHFILRVLRIIWLPVGKRLHIFLLPSLRKCAFHCLIPSVHLVKNLIFLFFLTIVGGLSFEIWLTYCGKLSCCKIASTDLSFQWKFRNTNILIFTSSIFLLSCRFGPLVFFHVLLQNLRNFLIFWTQTLV